MKDRKTREAHRKVVAILEGHESVVLTNAHVGLQIDSIRHNSNRFIVTCALEGINPFRQDEHEIAYQARKGGNS